MCSQKPLFIRYRCGQAAPISNEDWGIVASKLRPNGGTVVVAVDEPEPVEEMLRLADLLSEGDQARIITLTVSLGSVEHQEEALGAIEKIVARAADQGAPVTSLVVSATSVARGILDVAREHGADLILLGLSRNPAQRSGVGSIAPAKPISVRC